MKIGDGSNVPRITCHGARQEAARVVNEVGEDRFDKILRELGDWGWSCSRCLRGISTEQPLDFCCGSVPQLVNKQLVRYRNVSTAQ